MRPGGSAPRYLCGLIALIAIAAFPTPALADVFEVNKRGDHPPGACTPADCTLREAVIAAHANDGDDKIKLPSKRPYRLTRSATLPGPDDAKGDLDHGTQFTVGNGLTVVHPGSGRATINASAAGDRIFETLGPVKLKKLILRGGDALSGPAAIGGAILGDGLVHLLRSKVVGNNADLSGGGVHMEDGNLFADRSVIKGNTAATGGGVMTSTDGQFAIQESTIRDNHALVGGGGGLAALSDGVGGGGNHIRYSTVSHNTAAQDGGGVFIAAHHLFTYNSTFAHNSARGEGGGIYIHDLPVGLAFANMITIARNRADSDNAGATDGAGGGLYVHGTGTERIQIANSLLARNRTTAGAFNDCEADSPADIESEGSNLITTTALGCNHFGATGDILAPNPKIGVLKNRGGLTHTISLRAGSPAIGEADSLPTRPDDQRLQPRDGNPDIGAYER